MIHRVALGLHGVANCGFHLREDILRKCAVLCVELGNDFGIGPGGKLSNATADPFDFGIILDTSFRENGLRHLVDTQPLYLGAKLARGHFRCQARISLIGAIGKKN